MRNRRTKKDPNDIGVDPNKNYNRDFSDDMQNIMMGASVGSLIVAGAYRGIEYAISEAPVIVAEVSKLYDSVSSLIS